ncbi:MAG: hypothetical protein SGCHY_002006 [Lobulomycetales sp.]
MIPAGLVKDAKQITSHRKGERRAVRKNVQRQAFIRSTEELSSMPSVLASVEPSVVSAGKRESIVNQKNPTLPKKNTAVEKDYAQENAFKHANTAKRVEHISKNSEMQEFSFIYPKKDDSIQETKTKIFQNIKTPMVEPGLLYDDFEAEDMRLVATRDKSPASNDLERAHISLKPNNRKEVAVLKHTMVGLLRDLGVAEESQEYPTDMHAFLSVIQEEQRIYNSVFQEIIRQVTVNMSERGEILAEIRSRYSMLFSKVPKHVRHLHTELVAQRKLNKRLTEELLKSKETMSQLVSEVELVRKHDAQVSRQAQDTQEKLVSILTQSDNSEEILEEYHKLYRMQRDRLEKAITITEKEKRLWIDAAIKLSMRIGKESNISELLELHGFEQSRSRSANHIIKIISDQNNLELSHIEERSEDSRNNLLALSKSVVAEDQQNIETLVSMQKDIQFVLRSFDANEALESEAEQRLLLAFQQYDVKNLAFHLNKWIDQISLVAVRFTSDRDLSLQEDIVTYRSVVENWVEAGLKLMKRNEKTTNGKDYKALTENLTRLNNEMENWMRKIELRVSGEDGIASNVISLQNQLEDKYTTYSARDPEKPILAAERLQIKDSFHNWIEICSSLISTLSNTTEKEQARVPTHIDNWRQRTLDQITTDTDVRSEENTKLHSAMTSWMVHLLIKGVNEKVSDSWDEEFHQLNQEIISFNLNLLRDSGDMKMVSDDDSDLRKQLMTYTDDWLGVAKKFLEMEKITNYRKESDKKSFARRMMEDAEASEGF